MSAIDTLRDALFGNPPSSNNQPSEEGVLAAFTELYNQATVAIAAANAGIITLSDLADRDAFFADPGNQSKLVYVNDNNGAADDPDNGIYEYVDGAARIAEGFYAGLVAVVQPIADEAQTAAADAQAAAAAFNLGIVTSATPTNVGNALTLTVKSRNLFSYTHASAAATGRANFPIPSTAIGNKITVLYRVTNAVGPAGSVKLHSASAYMSDVPLVQDGLWHYVTMTVEASGPATDITFQAASGADTSATIEFYAFNGEGEYLTSGQGNIPTSAEIALWKAYDQQQADATRDTKIATLGIQPADGEGTAFQRIAAMRANFRASTNIYGYDTTSASPAGAHFPSNYNTNGSVGTSNLNWGTTGFTKIKGGTSYTIFFDDSVDPLWLIRVGKAWFWNLNATLNTTVNWQIDSSSRSATVLAPGTTSDSYYLSTNLIYNEPGGNVAPSNGATKFAAALAGLAIVEGTGVRAFEPAGRLYVDASAAPTPGPKFIMAGAASHIETSNGDMSVQRGINPVPPKTLTDKPVVEFAADYIDGALVKNNTDDVAPYRALGLTIGANHGYTMTLLTAAGHSKTIADVGQVISKSGVQFVIVGYVSSSQLYVTARADNGSATTGAYTYVSGGSNTAGFTATAAADTLMFPPFTNHVIRQSVDGVQVGTDADTYPYSGKVAAAESYDVLAKSEIVAWFEAGNGTTGNVVPDGDPSFTVSHTYEFDIDGNSVIYSDFLTLEAIDAFQDIMFAQCQRLDTATVPDYYIPKTLPLTHAGIDYDFANIESSDVSAWSSGDRLDFTPDLCEPTGLLADRVVMLSDDFGLAFGLLPVGSAAPDVRRENATVKALQMSDSFGKIYLSTIDNGGGPLAAGTYFSAISYRAYFRRDPNRTCSYAVRTRADDYFYVDWHDIDGIDRVPVPPDFAGRSFEVVEKTDNVTILSETITNSINFDRQTAGTYGYAILKVAK